MVQRDEKAWGSEHDICKASQKSAAPDLSTSLFLFLFLSVKEIKGRTHLLLFHHLTACLGLVANRSLVHTESLESR